MSVAGIDPLEGFAIDGHDERKSAPVVADVMRRDVVTVRPEMPIRQAAGRLLLLGSPGVVVVDADGRVVGALGEQDLMVRFGPRRRPSWWAGLLDRDRLAREYRRAVGLTVGEVMTPPAGPLWPRMPLSAAARLYDAPAVTLVPVMDDGCLVGSLSRRDLILGFLDAPGPADVPSDAELIERMRREMAREGAWVHGPRPAIHARDGILELWGLVDTEPQRAAIETMARAIAGCRGVESHLALKRPI